MVSTVYKGDISEVTFGKECGLAIKFGGFGGALSWATNAAGTVITFAGGTEGFFNATCLKYPVGMLVGSQLRVIGGGAFSADDNATKGHVYTIVANSGLTLTVSPAMKSLTTTATAGDELLIDTLGTPTIDVGMTYATTAVGSNESVLTDQFIGLAATVSLPETKVEIKRAHIVGVGRDVVIQEPQRFTNEGGSLETMMNSARWLYYALGREVVDSTLIDAGAASTEYFQAVTAATTLDDIAAGDTYIPYTGVLSNVPPVGSYILVIDATDLAFPTDKEEADGSLKWGANGTGITMDESVRNEIRQVLYVDTTTLRIHLDEPLHFNHTGYTLKSLQYDSAAVNGSPNFDTATATYGDITNRQSRLLFSGSTIPTFSLESSIRTSNTGSYNLSGESEAAPGSASDSKQLTRVWKGCKVKDFSLAADADAEVKLSINFDALYCYTDTGRLEDSDKGDRYSAHRMFENTGNGRKARKQAGIAPNTEKPYFFYNGEINAFGMNIAQVTNFSLSGNNNTEALFTIRGNSQAESRNTLGQSTEQVPFGGSRNPNLMIEKTMEYELSMSIIASDPLIWHEFRTNRTHNYTEPITLTLTKAGAGTTREEIIIVIDDYIISEAPLPIPEDKGVIKSDIKIMPKHVRVISRDAFLHM